MENKKIRFIKQSREFDFIINMSTKVELPFIVESISYEIAAPFFVLKER